MSRVSVKPVTSARWADFEQLFEAKGSPHYCWCTPYRFARSQQLGKRAKKAAMHALVDDDTPIGVLAYVDGEPVGWCSVAPRETYVKLRSSRVMPRVTPLQSSTWTILCFFVTRPHRQQGITRALLRGALAYARKRGAKVVEGYPFDSAGLSSQHLGHSSVYQAAGFSHEGRRWSRALKRA